MNFQEVPISISGIDYSVNLDFFERLDILEEKLIDDTYFINFSNNILNKTPIRNINKNAVLHFDGYFQHDKIYTLFKQQIVEFIKNHPEIILTTDHNEKYKAIDLVNFDIISNKKYNIVIHLRLEDFIEISHVINPISIKKIIDGLN